MTTPDNKPLFRTPAPGFEISAVEQFLAGPPELGPEPPEPGPEPSPLTEEYVVALEKRAEWRRKKKWLPHKYGWKWYPWAREFYESINKVNLLCAANQISKSSTQIRKCIEWATNKELWETLWLNRPVQFWYLYPTQKQIDAEWATKWNLFMPRGKFKDDPTYGWKPIIKRQELLGIKFHSGVYVFFKTYAQKASSLQTGTCDAIFCDEELPIELFDELMFRVSASDGYFHMVFTATLGQDQWRRAMEPGANEEEFLPQAYKKSISLYDAIKYEDDSPSHWTLEKIKAIEARCSTHNELMKRVYGRFIIDDEDRKCPTFDPKKHVKPKHPLPKGWLIYGGVDIGGGGNTAHPSSYCFVAVRPDFRQGRAFLGKRYDGQITTAGDVVEDYINIKKEHKLQTTGQWYDWGSKDFGEIAVRMGEPFEKAEKGHDLGEDVINTLFKNDMMAIYEDEELAKLSTEMATLKKSTAKKHAKDDFYDAFRYCVVKIPWDFSFITGSLVETDEEPEKPMNDMERQIHERRKQLTDENQREKERIDDEFREWNEAYGND